MAQSVRFGPFALDMASGVLYRGGKRLALGPKVVKTLAVLVAARGELVTKDELFDTIWSDRTVEEGNLTQNVYRLRKILASGGLSGAIETVPCRGYRFTVAAEPVAQARAGRPRSIPFFARVAAVVVALGILAGSQATPLPAFARLTPESQRLYRLARYHWNLRFEGARVRESLRDFDAVVRRDPDNPLGYSGRADAYLALYDVLCDSPSAQCARIVDRAYASAARAVDLDQRSAEAHTSLAMALHAFVRDDVRADAEFARAIALDPSYALAHHWYGNSLLERGAIDAATRQHQTALALEPASPATYAWLAQDAFYGRRYRDAVGFARDALAIYPYRRPTQVLLGLACERTRDSAGAAAAFGRLPRWQRAALAAEIFAREGKRDRAQALLRLMEREGAQADYPLDMAFAWIALGDRARARDALVQAHVTKPIELDLLRLDPRMDPVRGDPRFRAWTVRG